MNNKNLKIKRVLLWGIGFITLLMLLAGVSFLILSKMGKIQLKKTLTKSAPVLDNTETEEGWEEGWVRYNGEPYTFNNDVLTFLVMGIDNEKEVSKSKDETSGGQSDALFLVVVNPDEKIVDVVAMNRNMMAQIDVYDKDGTYLGQHLKQITLQHGYGDGMQKSCERTVTALSRHLYNLPINGYVSINMGAIRDLNAAVGGVTVTVLEDVWYKSNGVKYKLNAGEEVKLNGDQAYAYVGKRDYRQFDSASGRVERQKQYINEFVKLAKDRLKGNITFALDVYNTIQRYMVTDIDISEFTYLVKEILGYSFDISNLYTLPGETVMGEEFEEFYVDDEAVQELIMELFYEPVNK